jgi:hypothetical protein
VFAAGEVENVPAGQSLHEVAAENAENDPALQFSHVLMLDAPALQE